MTKFPCSYCPGFELDYEPLKNVDNYISLCSGISENKRDVCPICYSQISSRLFEFCTPEALDKFFIKQKENE